MSNKYEIKEIVNCRLCGVGVLQDIYDFGSMSLPTWPLSKEQGVNAPLDFVVCTSCGLGQLAHSINRESFFTEYWYRTGINNTMRSHMAALSDAVSREIEIDDNKIVVDVGANDGTLLLNYKKGILIGFEPSNLCPTENGPQLTWIHNFYDPKLIPINYRGKVNALTTISMFYYLDDPIAFAQEISSVLAPNGIWVCEMTYALDILNRLSFDFINHEHVTLWAATQFKKVVEAVGMELYKIERNDINGGSIRFWVGKKGKVKVESSVDDTLKQEEGTLTLPLWRTFAKRVKETSLGLEKIVTDLHSKNKKVMVYGASTRGLTILGSSKLDSTLIDSAVERNPEKVGRYYGSTQIPVISEEKMRQIMPEALLVLPYSFIAEFVHREKEYLDNGGIFIVPLPEPKMITKSNMQEYL